ncbi:TPA: pentapeptide repeat-containing protein [Yersinia enterocolitica]|nr:pentapeptide repeat-containing protein [Yersinia enterocolitica]
MSTSSEPITEEQAIQMLLSKLKSFPTKQQIDEYLSSELFDKSLVVSFCLSRAGTTDSGCFNCRISGEPRPNIKDELKTLLEQCLKVHEHATSPLPFNLSGLDMSYMILPNLNLESVNCEGADFEGTTFYSCNLAKTNLRRTNLKEAKMPECFINKTDCTDAEIKGLDIKSSIVFTPLIISAGAVLKIPV